MSLKRVVKSRKKKRAIYEDVQTNFNDTILKTKDIKPHFAPGTGKRAHYANINFEILGRIVEIVTNSTLDDVFKELIFDPLGLENTYLPKVKMIISHMFTLEILPYTAQNY